MHGGSIPQNPYCVYCTDAEGHLTDILALREVYLPPAW
jgi:hypothetical protein